MGGIIEEEFVLDTHELRAFVDNARAAIREASSPEAAPPHDPPITKEARRLESTGFLRGYSRVAFGLFSIVHDVIRGGLRERLACRRGAVRNAVGIRYGAFSG